MTRLTLTSPDVVRAAAALADRVGAMGMTVSAVAKSLGVTQPALYRHVTGFGDLQRQVAMLVRAELRDRLLDASAGRSGEEALRAVANAWRAYVREHPGRYAITDLVPLTGHPETEAGVGRLIDVIAQVLVGFGLSGADATDAAWAVRSALHGFATLEVGRGNPASLQPDAAYDRMVGLLVAGLQSARHG